MLLLFSSQVFVFRRLFYIDSEADRYFLSGKSIAVYQMSLLKFHCLELVILHM